MEQTLEAMQFYVVGSALHKKRPRDVDLCGVLDDGHFKETFGMDPEEFALLYRMKEDLDNEGMLKWRNECLGATRILQSVFPELVPIDFKFIPRSLLHEPNQEVDLTLPTMTWRIGLPDLTRSP
jgi:hypothetical protein